MTTVTVYLSEGDSSSPGALRTTPDAASVVAHAAELSRRLGDAGDVTALSPAALLVALLTCPSELRRWLRRSFAELELRHLPLLDELGLPPAALRVRGDVAPAIPPRIAEAPVQSTVVSRAFSLARAINAARGAAGVVDVRHLIFALLSLDEADVTETLRAIGAERAIWTRALTEMLMERHGSEAGDWQAAFEIEFSAHEPLSATAAELGRRCREGCMPASAAEVEPLLRRHLRLAFRACRAIVADATLAEAVLERALHGVAQRLDEYGGSSSFEVWLVQRVIEEASATSRNRAAAGRSVEADAGGDAEGGLQAAAAGTLQARLEDAVDGLPSGERSVLGLRAVAGLCARDCADALGIEPQQVRARLASARRLLQESLGLEDAVAAEEGLGVLFELNAERANEVVAGVLERLDERSSSGIRAAHGGEVGGSEVDDAEGSTAGRPADESRAEEDGRSRDADQAREASIIVATHPDADAEAEDAQPHRTRRSWLPFGKRSA